jgi:hypothetical protein
VKANQKLQYMADFFGLDRESQDALLAMGKVWKDRAAACALLKVIGAEHVQS